MSLFVWLFVYTKNENFLRLSEFTLMNCLQESRTMSDVGRKGSARFYLFNFLEHGFLGSLNIFILSNIVGIQNAVNIYIFK